MTLYVSRVERTAAAVLTQPELFPVPFAVDNSPAGTDYFPPALRAPFLILQDTLFYHFQSAFTTVFYHNAHIISNSRIRSQ